MSAFFISFFRVLNRLFGILCCLHHHRLKHCSLRRNHHLCCVVRSIFSFFCCSTYPGTVRYWMVRQQRRIGVIGLAASGIGESVPVDVWRTRSQAHRI